MAAAVASSMRVARALAALRGLRLSTYCCNVAAVPSSVTSERSDDVFKRNYTDTTTRLLWSRAARSFSSSSGGGGDKEKDEEKQLSALLSSVDENDDDDDDVTDEELLEQVRALVGDDFDEDDEVVPLIPDIMPSVEELLKGDTDDQDDRTRNKNSEVIILPRKVNEHGHSYGLGKRKAAIARAWLRPGTGVVMVNNMLAADYFGTVLGKFRVSKPFAVTASVDQFDVHCTVKGGGLSGQADAVSLAVSRALQSYDPPKRLALKVYNLLTRDSREVERKKPGRAKARKAFQWVKR